MDGWLAGSAGPAHPPPLAATAAAHHPPAQPTSVDEPRAHPPAAAPRVPPPNRGHGGVASPDTARPPPPPRGAADTQPAGPYIVDTAGLLDEVDGALAAVVAGGGDGDARADVLARAVGRAKAWLDRERRAEPAWRGRPGWRASAAAARPGLAALVEWWASAERGGCAKPPAAVLEAYRAGAAAARAALAAEDAVEAVVEAGP
jgi:hypothetical protein